nr:protein LURP-one-related 15-like [Solanum lycopersicum]
MEDFVVSDMNGNFMFKVKGNSFGWHDKRLILDATDNPWITLKQKMHKIIIAKSLLFGKDNFMVTMYPNIDQAFIDSLIVVNDVAVVGVALGS